MSVQARPELSVIVPCLNEERNVAELASRVNAAFTALGIEGEIVFVDDGSSDGTASAVERVRAEQAGVLLVSHCVNRGVVEAWYSGFAASTGRYIITLDADLQYQPEDIAALVRCRRERDAELVQGYRVWARGNSPLRAVMSMGLSLFLDVLFLKTLRDFKSGFVLYSREAFEEVFGGRGKYRLFEHFFILSAFTRGYTVRQVPVVFKARKNGKSFIRNPLLFSCAVLAQIPRVFIDFWFGDKEDQTWKA